MRKFIWLLASVTVLLLTACGGGSGDAQSSDNLNNVPPADTEPIADAGTNQNVFTGNTVTLDGSESYDPAGDLLSFNWSFVTIPSGSTARLADPTGITPSFITDIEGSYEIRLIVFDSNGNSAFDNVTVTARTQSNHLQLGIPFEVLSGDKNSLKYFQLDLKQPIGKLSISTTGGNGDVDLYVRYAAPPTLDHFDCNPSIFGNEETCEFNSPASGAWHILLHGYSAYSGVNLQADAITIGAPVEISGTLQVSGSQFLDGTTRDPTNPMINNNNRVNAQTVTIPATIGGYADNITDEWDVYRVTLKGETTILLNIADAETADMDLYLTDLNTKILRSSLGSGSSEIIVTSTDFIGDFLLWVHAFDGAGNYLLAIDINPASSSTLSTLLINGDFLSLAMPLVEDEVVVKFHATPQTAHEEKSAVLQSVKTERPYDLVLREELPSGAARMSISPRVPFRQGAMMLSTDTFPLRYSSQEEATRATALRVVKSLRRQANVDHADPNYLVEGHAIPNDPHYPEQWHFDLINLSQAWALTTGSTKIVTAVVDTGVVYTHPDLSQRMLRGQSGEVVGYDFIRRLADPFDIGDRISPWSQSSFHGTHVAGTIAATSNNATGVAGVTWQGAIMPLRVLGQGGGTTTDVAQAIRYAVGAINSSGRVPPVKSRIINLSLGPKNPYCETPYWPLGHELQSALEAAREAGALVVVAAGNDNCNVATPFSHFDGVINVGAVDRHGKRTPYSNYGSSIDLVAPGGDVSRYWDDGILSLGADDRYTPWRFTYNYAQGTSMAAPHVAGVLALMLSVNPNLSSEDIHRLIDGTHPDPAAAPITRDLGTTGRDDQFGYGLIDAYLAVSVAQRIAGGADDPLTTNEPVLSITPSSLNFNATTLTLPLYLQNIGTTQLVISEISTDAHWIDIDTSNLPTLTISINRAGLSEGYYLAAITIRSNGGSKSVPVILHLLQSTVTGEVGTVYVLLLDSIHRETVVWGSTNADKNYHFELTNVPPGRYYLLAGTDRNDDGYICDAGEACGRYPEFGGVSVLDIQSDAQLPAFLVNYGLILSDQNSMETTNQFSTKGVKWRDGQR